MGSAEAQSGAPLTLERYGLTGSAEMSRLWAVRSADRSAAFFVPHLRPGMRLLDCGCGPGSITIGLASAVAPAEAVGIDIQPADVAAWFAAAAKTGILTSNSNAPSSITATFRRLTVTAP